MSTSTTKRTTTRRFAVSGMDNDVYRAAQIVAKREHRGNLSAFVCACVERALGIGKRA